MSVWSLTCQRSYFGDIIVANISESFTHKMAAKASWHRNYVTVIICIRLCSCNTSTESSWSQQFAEIVRYAILSRIYEKSGLDIASIASYLRRLIQDREHGHNLRSTTTTLCQPFTTTTFAKRAFRCSAPAVWNSLPKTVLNSDSVAVFKSRLKTFLFSQAFSSFSAH